MDRNRLLIAAVLMTLLLHDGTIMSTADPIVFTVIRDLIQHNVAGVPVIHERTEWDFDPETGKERRVRYEQENGHYGEIAIAKLGMGIGYKGPWGQRVKS